jgi:hypothetical protein
MFAKRGGIYECTVLRLHPLKLFHLQLMLPGPQLAQSGDLTPLVADDEPIYHLEFAPDLESVKWISLALGDFCIPGWYRRGNVQDQDKGNDVLK